MSRPLPSQLPPEVLPLSWLLGAWRGLGRGGYPDTQDFTFDQEVVFSCDGRPFLSYASRSWIIDENGERVRVGAVETGYWRPRPDNEVEVLLTHPTGFAEVYHGTITVTGIENARITSARAELKTDAVVRTASAKEVNSGTRLYGLVDGELMWVYEMAAMGHPLQPHLSARLKPIEPLEYSEPEHSESEHSEPEHSEPAHRAEA
jgi:hypothetical protein